MSGDEFATRVMVFFSEDDRFEHQSLSEALLTRAREDGMAGATIWRAIEGFGSSGEIRTARFSDGNIGLPLVFEALDLPDRVEAFLPTVRELAPNSLVTIDQVKMTRYRAKKDQALDDTPPGNAPTS